ncbi:hypothetical protein BU15DRAFT_62848 [Melanogaster broomeanus]|nr:hypothetical protein BU15DRAFT_62848 [Melanogaster broomeanus]
MATNPESILASIQFTDYMTSAGFPLLQLHGLMSTMAAVFVTVVAYDYILTFPREVDHVWNRSWTWVSLLFFLINLPELNTVILDCPLLCYNLEQPFFFAAADLLMILRVYAMYNKSRLVLGILLASYVPSVVLKFIVTGAFYKPQIDVAVVFGAKICTLSVNIAPTLVAYFAIPQIIFSVLLCGFAVVHFVRGSLQMHRAIKQWRSNRYMELLVQGSLLYFVAYVVSQSLYSKFEELTSFLNPATSYLPSYVVSMVVGIGILQGVAPVLVGMLSTIAPIVLPARLVMNMREFHCRIVCGHIDTGFGATSRHQISINDSVVFANVEGSTESTVDYRGTEVAGTLEQLEFAEKDTGNKISLKMDHSLPSEREYLNNEIPYEKELESTSQCDASQLHKIVKAKQSELQYCISMSRRRQIIVDDALSALELRYAVWTIRMSRWRTTVISSTRFRQWHHEDVRSDQAIDSGGVETVSALSYSDIFEVSSYENPLSATYSSASPCPSLSSGLANMIPRLVEKRRESKPNPLSIFSPAVIRE